MFPSGGSFLLFHPRALCTKALYYSSILYFGLGLLVDEEAQSIFLRSGLPKRNFNFPETPSDRPQCNCKADKSLFGRPKTLFQVPKRHLATLTVVSRPTTIVFTELAQHFSNANEV